MGATHRLLGASSGAAWASQQHLTAPQATIGIALAVLTSAGHTSPDVDQSWLWHRADQVLPDELLGRGGPMQHRGLMHWWGLPLAAALAVATLLPSAAGWAVGAALAGWVSHLVGDLLFGKPDVRSSRGPGIPLMPWWCHVGLGIGVDGVLERIVVQRLALPALLIWQVLDAFGLAVPLARLTRATVAL
jgi:hypothetical protein